MRRIRIPENHIPGIEHLSLLDEKDIQLVYSLLKKTTSGMGRRTFLELFHQETKFDNNQKVAESIFSIFGLLTNKGISKKDLAKDVTMSFVEYADIDDKDQIDRLEDRIHQILNLGNNLKVTFDAQKIVLEGNKVLSNSDISSDVRLIFDSNQPTEKQNGLLLYKLSLDVIGEDDSLILTLDVEDLKKLKSQIELSISEGEEIQNKYLEKINFIQITE